MTTRGARPAAAAAMACLALMAGGCEMHGHGGGEDSVAAVTDEAARQAAVRGEALLAKYTTVKLTTDMQALTEEERRMIPLLIDAAREMDDLFWQQAYGDKEALLGSIADAGLRRFAEINYGPWDRLDGNSPFLPEVGAKPAGANLYPPDMTREELDAAVAGADDGGAALSSLYTLVRRDAAGKLQPVAYSKAFAAALSRASSKLRQAAQVATDPGLKSYLELRAAALLADDYRASDLAWLDMKNNRIDVVIGPIESYEDGILGAKASFEAYVLVKDREWSDKLSRYAALLPGLQQGLPVPQAYRNETPGTDSDLNAYDVIYYAGDCNAGSKTIAINLPNDEIVQLAKGTRRLQLKNAMRAKFDKILVPIADRLIDPEQRQHITFDAFFANTMFHEVAHGLGIKNTINDKGTVREALEAHASALEEGKADVLGLYMVTSLARQGELDGQDVHDNFVTFLASIFRSVRFGASSAHGRANMVRFNFFAQQEAFSRDAATGTYKVDFAKMEAAMNALSEKILRLQGDGDAAGVDVLLAEMGRISPILQADLEGLAAAGIPVDVVFEQGLEMLQ